MAPNSKDKFPSFRRFFTVEENRKSLLSTTPIRCSKACLSATSITVGSAFTFKELSGEGGGDVCRWP